MAKSILDGSEEKLHFAGHETFPLRYGWLKKAYDAVALEEKHGEVTGSIFNDEKSIAVFGVGRNMVLSMKHWALATGILSSQDINGERNSRISKGVLGNILFGEECDPYLEHSGSLWLLHWMLASRPGRATAWHWAFNEFHEPSFDRELLRRRLAQRCDELLASGRMGKSRAISPSTIKRDVDCLIRTYFSGSKGSRRAPEDSLECPLAELGLVQAAGVGELFRFRRGPKASLPDAVFLFSVLDFWKNLHSDRRSFSVEFLTFERGSPGQVFLMDEDAVAARLVKVEQISGEKLRWDESTGMRQLYMHDAGSLDPWSVIRDMYNSDLRAVAA